MSYERGKIRGRLAAKYGVSVGLLVFVSALITYPSTPLKWLLLGGVVYLFVSVVSLALMYLRPGGSEEK